MEKANLASDQLRQQLMRYLLLGTDQVSLAQQWPALLDQYGISGDTEASQLLELSAKVQLLGKGARTLPRWAAPLAIPHRHTLLLANGPAPAAHLVGTPQPSASGIHPAASRTRQKAPFR